MSQPIHLAIILGSTREGRLCERIGAWVSQHVQQRDEFMVTVVDPAKLDLPIRHEQSPSMGLTTLRQQLDRTDAFLVITQKRRAWKGSTERLFEDAQKCPRFLRRGLG